MSESQGDLTYSPILAVRAMGQGDPADMLAVAKKRALDPSVFDSYPPFFWGGEASNSNWDAYDTRMGQTTLQNYATEAEQGVAVLRNHDTRSDPLGYTLAGRYVGAQGNGLARMQADFYALADPATEPYIAKVRAGVVRDLSVGFYGGQWICSLCGRDMQQWFGPDACPHLLGMTYTPRDETGQPKGAGQMARATVEDAHLAEISCVYDGATPGAMISKARMQATEGQLDYRQRDLVEVRYRLHLPDPARRWAGTQMTSGDQNHEQGKEHERMAGEQNTEQGAQGQGAAPIAPPADGTRAVEPATTQGQSQGQPDPLTTIRAVLSEHGMPGADADTPLQAVRALVDEVTRLRPLADVGRQYRTDLVSEALGEGNRAMGTAFAQESYRAVLETAPLPTIKQMRDDWKRLGDSQFAGGRQTTEGAQPPTRGTVVDPPVPAAAHRG